MTKEELIAYLDVVCDAESAVQACEDAIAVFEAEKRYLPQPGCPTKPTQEVDTRGTEAPWNIERVFEAVCRAGYIFIPVFIVIFGISLNSTGFSDPGTPFLVAVVVSLIASIVWMNISEKSKVDKAYRARQEDARKRNASREKSYAHKLTIYQNKMPIYTSSMALLDTRIQEQIRLRDSLRTLLGKLYAHNIIYPTFRNLIAAFQIREYLQMGICDGLEGPDGAYAMYMNDVRTERICGSIHDLKQSLTGAIRSLQGTLVQELRTVNGNLSTLQSDLSSGMQGISRQMEQMQRLQQAETAQMNAHLTEANRHLASMRDNTAIMAHNQYVEQRMRNVDAYLLRWPNA